MPTGPSAPKFKKTVIPPRPHAASLETERQRIQQQSDKKKGYMSTVLTEGTSLGEPYTKKKKAGRLGVTGA